MDFLSFTSADIYRAVGIAGFLTYVVTYVALSFRWVTGECTTYFAGNTLAAAMVLVSLTHDFNMASVLIQVFWIGIGVWAIWIRLARRSPAPSASDAANLPAPPRVEPPLTRADTTGPTVTRFTIPV